MHFCPVLCEAYVDKISPPPSQRCKIKTLPPVSGLLLTFLGGQRSILEVLTPTQVLLLTASLKGLSWVLPSLPLHVCFCLSNQQAGEL